ncbi:MAG: heparinase II/III family protein [Verrucomicrobiae bacterium]|nr:heparinase II/III family protein [Verrucomicrobiae bacterium]
MTEPWIGTNFGISRLAAAVVGAITLSSAVAAPEKDADGGFRAPGRTEVLRTLKPTHPRLMLDAARIGDIRKWIDQDPVVARIHRTVLKQAERAMKAKPATYELRDGRRLLFVSGDVLERVTSLAYAFRMTGRREFARRAWEELDSAAAFKDWNPDHFLDTAVMTCAFSIGYDWLWDEWTPEQRTKLRKAIVRLGLKPAVNVYSRGKGWHKVTYNWNQVCNGGIAMGALAVADEEPEIAGRILSHAIRSIPLAMGAYAPDGGGREGVSYWDFGSRYNVFLLASLQSALGTDFGLAGVDGFRQSGDYQIYMSGNDRVAFDFSDSTRSKVSTPQHLWMGGHYGIPRYSWFRYEALRKGAGASVWDLLWFDPAAREIKEPELPPDRRFRGPECASMRDSWTDPRGFIVAMQGGSNRWTHRHHDLGSFILEADGERWIIDSGRDRQTYQRHVNQTPREDFYRVRAEGHNTLVIDPDKTPGQALDGTAAFRRFVSRPDRATAAIDLGDAYRGRAEQVSRSFELLRGKSFTVSDRIVCPEPAEVWSFFHTEADVTLSADKRTATFRRKGKSLVAELISPMDAGFQVLPAEPGPRSPKPSTQADNKGRRKLAVHLRKVRSADLKVSFSLPPAG